MKIPQIFYFEKGDFEISYLVLPFCITSELKLTPSIVQKSFLTTLEAKPGSLLSA